MILYLVLYVNVGGWNVNKFAGKVNNFVTIFRRLYADLKDCESIENSKKPENRYTAIVLKRLIEFEINEFNRQLLDIKTTAETIVKKRNAGAKIQKADVKVRK